MSVKQRIAGSLLLIIAVMLATLGVLYQRALYNEARVAHVDRYDVTGMAGSIALRSLLTGHMIQTYQLVIDAQTSHTSVVTDAMVKRFAVFNAALDRSYEQYLLTITDARDRALTAQFKTSLDAYRKLHPRLLELLDRKLLAQADTFTNQELMPQWMKCRDALMQMMLLNQSLIGAAMQEVNAAAMQTRRVALLGLGVTLLVAVICGVLLHRSITRPLDATLAAMRALAAGDLSGRLDLQRDDELGAIGQGFNNMVGSLRALVGQAQRSALLLTAATSDIAATARQQQAAVTESAASTSQIGITASDIAATSRDLVRTIGEVSGKADQAAHLASTGQMGLLRMAEVMRQLTDAATVVNDKLAQLAEKTNGIHQMGAGISKLAEQTHRAAQKAVDEAEEAGGNGRAAGMAVAEMRRIAQQTEATAEQIERKARELQSTVAAGASGVGRFSEEVRRGNAEMLQVSEHLQQIIHQIQTLAPRVQAVSTGMRTQSAGAEQINQALTQLGETSRQTAQALTQAHMAIQNVDKVAKELRVGVTFFKV